MPTNSNAQLTKLALGLVSVAALAGITGRLSATGAAAQGSSALESPPAVQAPFAPGGLQSAEAQEKSWSQALGERWEDDDDDDEEKEENEHERPVLRFSAPTIAGQPQTALPRRTPTRRS